MLYTLLIYADETWISEQPEQSEEHGAEMAVFVKKMADKIKGGAPLAPSASATTVRVREGDVLTTDGPFAETKEVLAGFFLVELEDLDEAIAAASTIPVARAGSIEVRPVAVDVMQAVAEAAARA